MSCLVLAIPTVRPAAAAPLVGCPDVLVIAARGSSEAPQGATAISRTDWNSINGAGPTLQTWTKKLTAALPKGRQLSVVSVNYPALPVTALAPDLYLVSRGLGSFVRSAYIKSVEAGVVDIQKRFAAIPSKCVGITNIVLAGYSSGAMVIHGLLKKLSRADRSKITAIVSFGNPYFDSVEPWAYLGSADRKRIQGIGFLLSRDGTIFGFNARGIPQDTVKKTFSYCMNRDPVCAAVFNGIPNLQTAGALLACAIGCFHTTYEKFLTSGVNPVNTGIPHVLRRLKFSDAKPLILQTTSLPTGVYGQPYSATLTASGGTAPYRFSLTSAKLPWLRLDAATGAITGTPTQVGGFIATLMVTDSRGRIRTEMVALQVDAPPVPSAPATLIVTPTATANGAPVSIAGGSFVLSGSAPCPVGTATVHWSYTENYPGSPPVSGDVNVAPDGRWSYYHEPNSLDFAASPGPHTPPLGYYYVGVALGFNAECRAAIDQGGAVLKKYEEFAYFQADGPMLRIADNGQTSTTITLRVTPEGPCPSPATVIAVGTGEVGMPTNPTTGLPVTPKALNADGSWSPVDLDFTKGTPPRYVHANCYVALPDGQYKHVLTYGSPLMLIPG